MGRVFLGGDPGVYFMEGADILRKSSLSISHLPTLMIIIGYAAYWVELYFFGSRNGTTTLLAWVLFVFAALYVFGVRWQKLAAEMDHWGSEFSKLTRPVQVLFGISGVLVLVMLAVSFYAALLPPHLTQEFDAIHYHYAIPRQHLIVGSFDHLRWSAADFYSMPLDFALAPYWFATFLPNKFPQFLLFLGLIGVVLSMVRHLTVNRLTGVLLSVLAVFGAHNIGIQLGTAMLDIALCYLFLAFLDSLFRRNFVMASVELTFFFWAKSFVPLQMTLITMVLLALAVLFKAAGFKVCSGWGDFDDGQRPLPIRDLAREIGVPFVVLSLLVGGPFVVKSFYYTGTPLFPFAVGTVKVSPYVGGDLARWRSIEESAAACLAVRNDYGSGRGIKELIKHFWLMAVPENGVNNQYDYPLGLVYLIFVGPFLYFLADDLRRKRWPLVGVFIVTFWALWWLGSQQTRFLYVPMTLMSLSVIVRWKSPSVTLVSVLLISVFLNTVSVVRAHGHDWGKPWDHVVREKDLKIIEMNREYFKAGRADEVVWEDHDVAFAQFPVKPPKAKLPFILQGERP